MKANKVVVTITVEALSIDVLPHMLAKVIQQIDQEMTGGELVADDGDTVIWKTELVPVEF